MTKTVVALNVGSNNMKFSAFAIGATGDVSALLFRGLVERCFGQLNFKLVDGSGNSLAPEPGAVAAFSGPAPEMLLSRALAWIVSHSRDYDLQAMGHRVVHGGRG